MSTLGLLTDSFSIKLPDRKLKPSSNFIPTHDTESQQSIKFRVDKFNQIQKKIDLAFTDIIQSHYLNSIKEISEFLYGSNEIKNHLPLLETAVVLTGYNRSDHDTFYSHLMENQDFLFAKLAHVGSLKDVVKSINQQLSKGLSQDILNTSDLDFQRVLKIQEHTNKQIVVIIPNFEEFNLSVLEKLIQLLIQSTQIKLVIGVFTLDHINTLSPRALNSLITKPFQIENSKEIIDEITRIIMNMDFKLGYIPFKSLLDNFHLSFLSIEMFKNGIKYCLMSYCFGNPYLGFLELAYEAFDKDSFKLLKMLPSFKSYINEEIKRLTANEQETDDDDEKKKKEIKLLLNDDRVLFEWAKDKIVKLNEYTRDFNNAIRVFEKMQSLFSTSSLKRPIRTLYVDALKNVEEDDEKYIIKEGLKRVRQELSSTRKRNQLDLSFSLFEKKPDQQILSKIITFLSNYFTKHLQKYSAIVLNELLYFDSNVNKAIKAEPRSVIQTGLKYPQVYTSTIVDTNILYKLYLECGRLINLQDWFEAFKVLSKHDNIE
ncbi:Origin recognition complex subunit 3 [Terramyces sp. JEL0728]|nr:Origin recognition complex subunit 3 [Terramyces sp. JEL0728]